MDGQTSKQSSSATKMIPLWFSASRAATLLNPTTDAVFHFAEGPETRILKPGECWYVEERHAHRLQMLSRTASQWMTRADTGEVLSTKPRAILRYEHKGDVAPSFEPAPLNDVMTTLGKMTAKGPVERSLNVWTRAELETEAKALRAFLVDDELTVWLAKSGFLNERTAPPLKVACEKFGVWPQRYIIKFIEYARPIAAGRKKVAEENARLEAVEAARVKAQAEADEKARIEAEGRQKAAEEAAKKAADEKARTPKVEKTA